MIDTKIVSTVGVINLKKNPPETREERLARLARNANGHNLRRIAILLYRCVCKRLLSRG